LEKKGRQPIKENAMMATKVVFDGDTVVVHNFCVWCKKDGSFVLTPQQYRDIVVKGKFVQDVFPDLNDDEREFMISGTHSVCWNEMFKPKEQEA